MKIGNTDFNVQTISEMEFEDFAAAHPDLKDAEIVYKKITGKDAKAKKLPEQDQKPAKRRATSKGSKE